MTSVGPKLQFENLCPRWFWCKWSMGHTSSNSDLLARFNFSVVALKALHNPIFAFHSIFTSSLHPLPWLPVPPSPNTECTLYVLCFCNLNHFAMLEEPHSFLLLSLYIYNSLTWNILIYLMKPSSLRSPLWSFLWPFQTEVSCFPKILYIFLIWFAVILFACFSFTESWGSEGLSSMYL